MKLPTCCERDVLLAFAQYRLPADQGINELLGLSRYTQLEARYATSAGGGA